MTAGNPMRVDLSRIRELLTMIDKVRQERGYDSFEDTVEKIEACPGWHQDWLQILDRKGRHTDTYRCRDCGLTPELGFALDIELSMASCGHDVYTARDYELIGHHVDTQLLSETAHIWSCSMEMDD